MAKRRQTFERAAMKRKAAQRAKAARKLQQSAVEKPNAKVKAKAATPERT